uniref:E3 ubiquitin-protein ligase TRIM21-like n=1 Tax=Semicossyphus pulcher TaxID=241346 RepID=UPI0037E96D78
MSSVCSLLSEEQFLCSICLDVFTDPVTIPCGHNFCKKCITQHWNINVPCECPLCKDVFQRRPELRVNTFISEMAAQVRQSALKKTSCCSVRSRSTPGEVLCDVCTETKVKALKSCLMCLTSYCETHLEPHHRVPGLKRHELIDPVETLEDRMCKIHDRPLELFCKTDQKCVCQFCTESDHKSHLYVPMMEEYKVKKAELVKFNAEIQQKVQERRLKMEQIKQLVKLSEEDADRETETSVQVFTALMQTVERSLAELIDVIKEKHRATEKQAEGFIKELQEEISELMKRGAEVEQLSHTEDHLQFLQGLPSLNSAPPTNEWTEVRVHSSYEGTVRRAVAQLEETLSKEMKKLCVDAELKRVRQYAVDVTLDPDTAHPALVLSDDEKQVKSIETEKCVPDSPQRFSICNGVLGKQGFSSGRFYYEVQVRAKTDWDLGVASESIIRKGKILLSPKHGFWTVWLRKGKEYRALAGPGVLLSLKSKPQKVGVFVDYEQGLVSFYDVDTATLMYSFTGCNFTGKLYPYFSPCSISASINTAPLILLPLTTQSYSLSCCVGLAFAQVH